MVFPVIRQTLVESTIFFPCDVLRITSPDRLSLVELLVRRLLLLNLLGLLLLGLVVLVVDLLDLGLLTLLDFLLSALILNFL